MGYSKPSKQPIKKKPLKKKSSKVKIIALSIVGLLLLAIGGALVHTTVSAKNLTNQAAKTQEAVLHEKAKTVKLSTEPDKTGSYAYGADNDGIPNAEQLKAYQAETTPMTTWGFAAAPVQDGLANPINVLPINEGVSNQTLAWGFGTVKPGYKMGQNNNIIAAHNFADGVTYASPFQYIDVSKRPKFYQTDGKKVYTYELSEKQTVGAISREYTDAVQQSVKNKITLVTCDEPNFIVNLDTTSRIIVTGDLVDTMNYKDAPADIKALFPKL